ncbi:MAG: hypothetical protein SFU56_12595 [Capsulimonadales bacterium]|nr:hypothetical protein [Capsulimonadales bacterium]
MANTVLQEADGPRQETQLSSSDRNLTTAGAGRLTDRPDFAPVTSSPTAGNEEDHRVRPAELAEALSAIEGRRRTVFLGTLSTKRAVQELQISVSPDEIWEEVRAQREQRAQIRPNGRKGLPARDIAKVAVGIGAVIVTGMAVRSVLSHWSSLQPPETAGTRALPAPLQNTTREIPRPPAVEYRTTEFFVRTPTTKALGDLKDGEPISMRFEKFSELMRLLTGSAFEAPISAATAKGILVNSTSRVDGFDVVRYGGKFYLRAYVPKSYRPNGPSGMTSPGESNNNPWISNRPHGSISETVTVRMPAAALPPNPSPRDIATANTRTSTTRQVPTGPFDTQVQIPWDAIKNGGYSGRGDQESQMYQFGIDWKKLDKRAWDTWKPSSLPKESQNVSSASAGTIQH